MARKVWFQLVDAATRGAYADTQTASVSSDGVSDIEDLCKAVVLEVKSILPSNVIAANVRVYANRAAYDDEHAQPLDPRSSLNDLDAQATLIVEVPTQHLAPRTVASVVVPEQEPPATQIFATFRPYSEGINVRLPHLPRDALVEKLHDAVLATNFVLLSSPAGSGKTSLLTLFRDRYPAIQCVAISLNHSGPASQILSPFGIDVSKQTCLLPDDGAMIVVMLDDSQRQYHDVSFWSLLVKGALSWIPPNVRFVISATHSLESEWPDSPVDFRSFRQRIMRGDLLLGDEEVIQLFDLGNGLPSKLRSPAVEEVIIRECAGHIGALRIFIDNVVEFFEKTSPHQQEVLAFCFSETVVQAMGRLYGRRHVIPSSIELQTFLIKCLLDDTMLPPMNPDEISCFTRLMKAGIITQDATSFVKFTSPLATRYYSKYLFPKRGHHNPSSLNELIRKVIGNMSARVLRQSTVDKNDFPKEATFQHQFMEGLALWTEPACSICPELSKVFPALPHQRSQRIRGEIDFYLDGSLRWGIELLVNGDNIGEHMSRFAPKGKYAALAAKAHAVIDFRGNKTGKITDVARKPERVTVFFKLGEFSSCRCIFGLVEDAEPITLSN
ncbi:hypothetical protein PHYPSEUDO_012238 [Phytophthora pseudosyringae]|uniref:Uncharacterized protein n=1 Tax=Phytophthora pseudosyringae TaxID=221518 RepID=A0A8T1VAC5_9STRA|nr:hypothetical protein PHYPSEUDO_012238 [Phytophthora pseudosyringae]